MKNLILILIISLSTSFWLQAQSLHPILIGAAGGTFETTEVYWQFAVGEPLTGTIDESEVQNLSIFWLQGVLQPMESTIALPLDWLAFWGRTIDDRKNRLTWQVEHDGRNAEFIVQRSSNGVQFMDLARMEGNGIPGNQRIYEFVDSLSEKRSWYYRIQQVDHDGAYAFSEVIFLEMEESYSKKITLAPNPAREIIQIFGSTSNEVLTGQLAVYNSFGRLLYAVELEAVESASIHLKNWPKGVYHYLWRDIIGKRNSGSFVKH